MLAYYYFVFVVFADYWLLSFGVGTSVIQSADCNCLFSKCSVAVVILKYSLQCSFAVVIVCCVLSAVFIRLLAGAHVFTFIHHSMHVTSLSLRVTFVSLRTYASCCDSSVLCRHAVLSHC